MDENALIYDVVLVGASSANLALAHHLIDIAAESNTPLSIAIVEKGPAVGAHAISGLVSRPHVLEKLFPNCRNRDDFPLEAVCHESHFKVLGTDGAWDVPAPLVPPGLKKEGYFILTLSHLLAWMANELEQKAAGHDHIQLDMFTGFSAHAALYEDEGEAARITGIRLTEDPNADPAESHLYGRITVFGEKGFISREVLKRFNLTTNPQPWSVGVKEVWKLADDRPDVTGKVWHTMGWPLVDGSFGGGFVYGMKDKRLSIGLIASLDSPNPNLNPQARLQDYKKHPWLQHLLNGGELVKYGAALLPEGGWFSLPKQFHVPGALFVGDALGVLDIARLSGVDKAMESGWQAAEVIHQAIRKHQSEDDEKAPIPAESLEAYKSRLLKTFVGEELYEGRYFRYAWQENPRLLTQYLPKVLKGIDDGHPYLGLIKAGFPNPLQAARDAIRLKQLMDGRAGFSVAYQPDAEHIRPDFKLPPATEGLNPPESVDARTLISRPDAVFYAGPRYHEGNMHIDEFDADVCVRCISRYDSQNRDVPCVSDCTAEVHRIDELSAEQVGTPVDPAETPGEDQARSPNGELALSIHKRHGMSLENCIQCRTCEIVCPEENLRVRPTEAGAGPDFTGL